MTAIWVTGLGLHGSLGDAEECWQALRQGRSGVRLCELPDADGLPPLPAAPALPGSPAEFLADRKLLKYMSPATSLAVLAAGRALRAAGLLESAELRAGMSLHLAAGLIAFEVQTVVAALQASCTPHGELDHQRLGSEGLRRCHPLMPFKMLLNMPLGLISIVFGIKGENGIYYPGPAQTGACFEAAARGLRRGRCERALVGGTSHGFSLLPVCTLARQEGPGSECAPGDAAAFVVLETESAARARGARPLALLEAATSGLAGDAAARDELFRGLAGGADVPRVPGSLDGTLGALGPASLAVGVALGALMLARGRLVGAGGAEEPLAADARLLVSSHDFDGGCGAVLLRGAAA